MVRSFLPRIPAVHAYPVSECTQQRANDTLILRLVFNLAILSVPIIMF